MMAALIAISAIIASAPVSKAVVDSGSCGDGVYWNFDDLTGVLSITGNGEIDSDTEISDYGDSVKTIHIGEGITSVDGLSFLWFDNLEKITVDTGNSYFYADPNGILYDYNMEVLYCYPRVNGPSDFVVPSSVTTIESWAFCGVKNLRSINLHGGIKTIEFGAFEHCTSLKKLDIPYGTQTLGPNLLEGSGVEEISISATVTEISGYFELAYSLKKITVDPGNRNFCSDANGALYNKDMSKLIRYPKAAEAKTYTVSSKTKTIGTYAFFGCENLEKLIVPEGVEILEHNSIVMYYDSVCDVYLPSTIHTVSKEIFRGNINVYYAGSEDDWSRINILPTYSDDPPPSEVELDGVTMHYNAKAPAANTPENNGGGEAAQADKNDGSAEKNTEETTEKSDEKTKTKSNQDKLIVFICANVLIGTALFLIGFAIVRNYKNKNSQ